MNISLVRTATIAALGLSMTAGFAQVATIPVEVRGNVRFSNSNPALLAVLGPPGNQGLQGIVASARSTSLGRTASGRLLPAASFTSADFAVVVDTVSGGADFTLSHTLYVSGIIGPSIRGVYYINPGPSVVVAAGPALTGIDSVECAGVLRVRFINASGASVSVAGGELSGFDVAAGFAQAGLTI